MQNMPFIHIDIEFISLLGFFSNGIQISCLSSSPRLVDRTRYKSYFQIIPTETSLAPAFMLLLKHFQWRHITMIIQDLNLFTLVCCMVSTVLKSVFFFWCLSIDCWRIERSFATSKCFLDRKDISKWCRSFVPGRWIVCKYNKTTILSVMC